MQQPRFVYKIPSISRDLPARGFGLTWNSGGSDRAVTKVLGPAVFEIAEDVNRRVQLRRRFFEPASPSACTALKVTSFLQISSPFSVSDTFTDRLS